MFLPYVRPTKEQLLEIMRNPGGPRSFKEGEGDLALYKILDISTLRAFKPFMEYVESPYFVTSANYDARIQSLNIGATLDVSTELTYSQEDAPRLTTTVVNSSIPKLSLSVNLLVFDIVPKEALEKDTIAHNLEKFIRSVRRHKYVISRNELETARYTLLETLRSLHPNTSYTEETLEDEIRTGSYYLGLVLKDKGFLVEVTSVSATKDASSPYTKTMGFSGIVETYTFPTGVDAE